MAYEIDLSGRVAFVTGASSGLGAHFAKTLSAAGAGVVLAARRVERLKTLRAEIESLGGSAHVVELDVTNLASIRAATACSWSPPRKATPTTSRSATKSIATA